MKPLTTTFVLICLMVLAAACAGGPEPAAQPTPMPVATVPSEPTFVATEPPAPAPTEGPTVPPTDEPTAEPAIAAVSDDSDSIDPAALAELSRLVEGFVAGGKVVGAEVAVIKDQQVLLHEAFGWNDQERQMPLEIDSLYNIRSMTKPVIGTAVLMLVDEGKLALDDRVADYLPAFDNDSSRDITVEHLLTHRSGLPLSILTSFDGFPTLRSIADAAGKQGPDFPPGSAFQYSDTGMEVLGALVEVVAGMPLDQFLQERVLDPLQMDDTLTLINPEDPRAGRIASAFLGNPGSWSLFWQAGDESFYPYTMGSQSLYTTIADYARFLALWMDGGKIDEQQLLSQETVERALAPVSDSGMPGGFPGLRLDYGQTWIVYVPEDAPEGEGEMALFGHSGSDGTWAWAWPERDLMVFYFTQSRGQGTGIGLEGDLYRLFVDPDAQLATDEIPEDLQPYLGSYVATSGPLMYRPFEILVQNGKLAVNVPEQIVVELLDPDEEGLWRLALDPSIAVSFIQDDAGDVIALNWHQGGEVFEVPRGEMPQEPPLDVAAVEKYLGLYDRPEEPDADPVEVLIHNGHLAVKVPEAMVILELFPPDAEGRWIMRLNPSVSISFQEDEAGSVISFTSHTPDENVVRPRLEQ
jgi:CubicO group peptidase (beta-lactamase class C family)